MKIIWSLCKIEPKIITLHAWCTQHNTTQHTRTNEYTKYFIVGRLVRVVFSFFLALAWVAFGARTYLFVFVVFITYLGAGGCPATGRVP